MELECKTFTRSLKFVVLSPNSVWETGLRMNLFCFGGIVKFFFFMPHRRRIEDAKEIYFRGG